MNNDIIASQIGVYRAQFLEYGDTPDGTFNQSELIQNIRFSNLLKPLLLKNSSLHDVGCGICDLYEFLSRRNESLDYSGTEIVPEMVDLARVKYPELTISTRDILAKNIIDRYDYVVQSGVFNLPGDQNHLSWKAFTRSFIRKMYEMSTKAISFNFLNAQTAQYIHPDMYYEQPSEVLEFCLNSLSRFCIINQSYPLYEFTVTVFNESYLKSQISDPAILRYFN